ncbi:hypothetical protein [Leptotrichia sp. OH3620_COT-345]|uniref:hypothetical protein n=1 Tax=Leptotrichia sp. OH3620_COT-345 TaxID=2491048 RepID=UPI0013155DC7|nr:hypothetical protein [Leptotrichia sp. OH3620_COT-345]
MKNLPAITVKAFKDEKKGGKLDIHKTDLDSVKKAENEILKHIKFNSQIIKGERNVRNR